MPYIRIPLLLTLVLSVSAFSGNTGNSSIFNIKNNGGSVDTVTISNAQLTVDDNGTFLQWKPLQPVHHATGLPLAGYLVYYGFDPYNLKLLSVTAGLSCHPPGLSNKTGFFRVVGLYGEGELLAKYSPLKRRDDRAILDFEQDTLALESFSEQDNDTLAWALTDDEAAPGSDHSLMLTGNTWKCLEWDAGEIQSNTVWEISVTSVDGDTMANLQAFGFSDGEEQLFYSFHGLDVIWDVPWMVNYQDVNPRGRWFVYRMAVGYDWTIRYGYEPEISELYFINDNDSNDVAATIYFDELWDITESIPPDPVPSISWRFEPGDYNPLDMSGGRTITFACAVANRRLGEVSYLWDFGDGATSDSPNPTHLYRWSGIFTTSLTVTDENRRMGRALTTVQFDDVIFPAKISACFTGDVMLGRRYEDPGGIIVRGGAEAVFDRIRDRFADFDLRIINLECLLTDEGIPHPTKDYIFRGNPNNVRGLTSIGVDAVSLGNNHVHDYGERGLEETLGVLDFAGIARTGAGMNEYEALQPALKTVEGIRVGVLGYCNRTGRDDNTRPFGDAGYDRYGFAYFSADNLLRSIPEADEQCDVLVVYVHGGEEYATVPTRDNFDHIYEPWDEERMQITARRDSSTIELEHLAIDLGADLVIGTHPHVLQGFEVYDGIVIAHSLGNFAFDQNLFETWPSALVCADITREGVKSVWIEPFFVDNYLPTPATENLGKKVLDRLADYSTELNCLIVPDYDNLTAEIAIDPNGVDMQFAEHSVAGEMRWFEEDSVYRSEPLKLDGGGFPIRVVSVQADERVQDWRVSLGREILLVGNMENEGAEIWNYNSDWEGREERVVHGGQYSSYIIRQQGFQDGITDLIQRIPVTPLTDRFSICGWLRTTNATLAGIAARFYIYRYNTEERFTLGDIDVDERLEGDNDWTYVWDNLSPPENAWFMNVRWQLYSAIEGQNQLWCDDLEVIRWDDPVVFGRGISIDAPNDLFYLQVETTVEIDQVEVTYRTATLQYNK